MTTPNQTLPKVGDLIYVQYFTGLAFIGRFKEGLDSGLILSDALQVINVPVQIPTPRGLNMSIQPAFVPINHLARGPEDQMIQFDLALTVTQVPPKHPLEAMYVKQTSNIEVATPAQQSRIITG